MALAYILFYSDEAGKQRIVPIRKPQFTIGRSADNDLPISNQKLSRSHALIEIIGGSPYLSDAGSQNGTTVNDRTVLAPVRLSDGDIINFGGGVDVTFAVDTEGRIAATPVEVPQPVAVSGAALPTAAVSSSAESRSSSKLPIIAGAAIGLILLVTVVLVVLTMGSNNAKPGDPNIAVSDINKNGSTRGVVPDNDDTTNDFASVPSTSVTPVPGRSPAGADTPAATNSSDDELQKEALRVMSRISTDNSPYISDQGFKDIVAKVRGYKGSSSLSSRLKSMSRGCAEINTLAQTNSLKPALLEYAALAQSESGGDPLAVARTMAPKLLTLRATFGTDSANSSLLLVAAYPYPFNPELGSQARTAHPLASKLVELGGRKSTDDTAVARSVWFLHEKDGIMPEAYDLVVRFVAIGIIAANPQQYGVDSDPLFC